MLSLQEVTNSVPIPERQAVSAVSPAKQPAGPSLPRGKGRPKKFAHQCEGQLAHQSEGQLPHQSEGQAMQRQQQAIHAQYTRQQTLPAQPVKWHSDVTPPQLYNMAHSSGRASSMLVQQPQLRFRQLPSRPATASTRVSSGANLGASLASLDEEELLSGASQQQQQQASDQPAAQGSAATAVAASSGGGSLYACMPPGRPPGRRLAVVRWVLNQRALWREGQLTPVQMQYMTVLGLLTFLLRLTESMCPLITYCAL